MDIAFTRISDQQHAVDIRRADGTSERVEFDTRSFLRHDLAHFAVESEVPIRCGFWGSVAAGASLDGDDIDGAEAALAESLAARVQTLMRLEAGTGGYLSVLGNVSPDLASMELAARIHEHVRRLRGHWKATPFGGVMRLVWPE